MNELMLCNTFENKDLNKLGVSVRNWLSKVSGPDKEIEIINTTMGVKGDYYALVVIYKEKILGLPNIGTI